MEKWLPVVDWEDVYEVSDHGRVRRIVGGTSTYAGRVLTHSPNAQGYPRVRLRYMGREDKPLVHCLVAAAFIGPRPTPKTHINHKDGNRANPRLDNLEYTTCSENHLHAYRVLGRKGRQLWGEKNNAAKLNGEKVSEIIAKYKTGNFKQSQLAADYGVTQSMISQITRRAAWTMLETD